MSAIFRVRQIWVWMLALQDTSPQGSLPILLAVLFWHFVFFLLIFPALKQRRGPRMLPSLFHLYSPSRWSPRVLDVISKLWLSFVPWALRNLFLKPWPVLKTPDSFIQLPVRHLLLEVYERNLTVNGSQTESWSSLCPIPPPQSSHLSWEQLHPSSGLGQDPWNHPGLLPSSETHIQSISESF